MLILKTMKKELTTEQLDAQILDLAEQMIKLMKLKGFEDNSHIDGECECLQIWIHDTVIYAEAAGQKLGIIQRKKK